MTYSNDKEVAEEFKVPLSAIKESVKEIIEGFSQVIVPSIKELLINNLDKEIENLGNEKCTVAEAIYSIATLVKFEEQEEANKFISYLTSIASVLDNDIRTKIIKEEIDSGFYSRIKIEPTFIEVSDGTTFKPGYMYTVGLSLRLGFELIVSSNADNQFLGSVIQGVVGSITKQAEYADCLDQIKENGVYTFKDFLKVGEDKSFDVKLVKVDTTSAVQSHMPYIIDPILELGDDVIICQIYLPDPNGNFPNNEDYDQEYGQEVLKV